MDEMTLRALSKINIGLDVTGTREDGYHIVKMIMQTLNLHDTVKMKKIKQLDIQVANNLYYLPNNENNLAFQAAKMLQDEFSLTEGLEITLTKRIPVAGGMAGGSTDAAAVLYGMNRLFNLQLSQRELMARGVKLGADIPYCIMRGTALAEGIGEELTRLPGMPKCHVLIVKPPISVSTKQVYQQLDQLQEVKHPDIESLIEEIEKGSLEGIGAYMGNVLEEVTVPMYPVIEEIKQKMIGGGAVNAMMTGSGPTVFGFFEKKSDAKKTADQIRASMKVQQINVTSVYNLGSKGQTMRG